MKKKIFLAIALIAIALSMTYVNLNHEYDSTASGDENPKNGGKILTNGDEIPRFEIPEVPFGSLGAAGIVGLAVVLFALYRRQTPITTTP